MKRVLRIALAVVGILVGAGFASGQEMLQFFVAFGSDGLWGVLLTTIVMTLTMMVILQFGSYFRATDHGYVLNSVTHPVIARILDVGVIITLFSTGFVMFAGAGANLNQQWKLPTIVGAIVMLALTLVAGFLDVQKVTDVIGAVTPFVVVLILIATIHTFFQPTPSMSALDVFASTITTTLPTWWIAAINYVGFCLMVGVAMSLLIGGSMWDPKLAGRGGMIGGAVYSLLLALIVVALYMQVNEVRHTDMPTLAIMNAIHPIFGQLMAVVIFAMIFNTAVGMFYALASRLAAGRRDRFRRIYVVTVLVGFGLSFVGFKKLVGWVYPTLGYLGILLVVVLLAAWARERAKIDGEALRRRVILVLTRKKRDRAGLRPWQQRMLDAAIHRSPANDDDLRTAAESELESENG